MSKQRESWPLLQDNRLRVWDYIYDIDKGPSREIVHSHDFNRYLTGFRAEWDPKDDTERIIVVGRYCPVAAFLPLLHVMYISCTPVRNSETWATRKEDDSSINLGVVTDECLSSSRMHRYISEDFGGIALHPVDIMDSSTGRLISELVDPNLATICPVNKPHPRLEVIVSGSSRSLYVWRPAEDEEAELPGMTTSTPNGSGVGGKGELRGSEHFTAFDADPDSGKKKPKGKGGVLAGEDEEDDDPGPKKKRGKK